MKYPKIVISQSPEVEREYEVIAVEEIDGFVLSATTIKPEGPFLYVVLAFPMEEGIGGRLVHQWNLAYVVTYYYCNDKEQGNTEVSNVMRTHLKKYVAEITKANFVKILHLRPRW